MRQTNVIKLRAESIYFPLSGCSIELRIADPAQAVMADKDPFRQLKDLSLLKGQLEDLQRRMEDEVGVGIPQGGSVLSSPFLKGFLAGYVVAKLRSSAILGVLVGTCTGIYAAQSYQVPNIEQTIKNYFSSFRKR
ncbi:SLC35A4 upstream open reading frame protein [Siphateles boraxobius]|uniref:SLC35A4 upstream open reading frame protein n=1 Tax=Siphateles boraxobius TaxID=180520 RepID=UPI004062D3CF